MPAALLALAPKCALCVLAYIGLGAALGLGGPEFCGGAREHGSAAAWIFSLAWIASAVACGVFGIRTFAHGVRHAGKRARQNVTPAPAKTGSPSLRIRRKPWSATNESEWHFPSISREKSR